LVSYPGEQLGRWYQIHFEDRNLDPRTLLATATWCLGHPRDWKPDAQLTVAIASRLSSHIGYCMQVWVRIALGPAEAMVVAGVVEDNGPCFPT